MEIDFKVINNAHTTITTVNKINSIQVLRGIAASIISIYHTKDLIDPASPLKPTMDFLFSSGAAGVNLFFVISGFIMVYITRYTTSSVQSFYTFIFKRFIRIWPTYALITILYAFAVFHFNIYPEINNIISSLVFLPLTLTGPPFYGYSVLPVGWSLNYEIYFYILVGSSILFSQYKWLIFFSLIIITLIVIPLSTGHFTFDVNKTHNYNSRYINLITNPIVWNFVYGVIIGLLYTNNFSFSILTKVFSRLWIVSLFIVLAVWQYLSGFFGGLGPLQWGVGSSALFLAFIFYTSNKPIIFPSWLIKLGDMSFSIYLMHFPVKILIETIFKKLQYPVYSSGTAMFFLTISITVILSSLSYEYIEIKFSNFLRNLFPSFNSGRR